MSFDHILSTKLVIPTSPTRLVPRPRLLQLDKLQNTILVCAPAGYGKTTLISSWAKNSGSPVAWFSLDADDNDPIRFLMHFVTAIQTQFPDFGTDISDMLEMSPPPPIDGLMRALVNQLCNLSDRLCIILDDLHAVSEPAVHKAIAFLIDHQPPRLQLIFASRSDPSFSLARLRGQGKLLEYRTNDLRFTLEEAGIFCNEIMQFSLSQEQVETLATRTEGWIVGLQLAAVSLHRTPDKTGFIESFAGDDRHIADFLLDEVLRSRSEDIQNFLLHTSLLERFCAPLCDAVTQRSDSRAMIDEIERTNMFIFGLDRQREWYRYHHLFTSLLQTRLRLTDPSAIKVVHLRASRWFSQNELIPEAINHAIKAGDYEFAIDLMEQHGSRIFSHGRINNALAWAQQLPPDLVSKRPILSLACAWGNFYMDNLVAMERHICAVAYCLADFQNAPLGSKERAMLAQVALLRGCQLAYNGHIENATLHFQEAFDSFSPGRTLHRVAAVSLGVCYFASEKLDDAQKLLSQHAAIAEVRNNLLIPITAVLGLARIELLRGRLPAAKQMYEQALQECTEAGWKDFPACGMLHIGLGELAYEMNDLVEAERNLVRGVEMTASGMQYGHAWGQVLLAQTRLAMGLQNNILDPERELALRKYSGRFVGDFPPLSSALARLWLNQGRLDEVRRWSEAAQLPLDTEPAIGREAEYLVLARFFIVTGKSSEAMNLLSRLQPRAQQGNRLAVIIEILVLKSLSLQAQRSTSDALGALQQALDLANNTGLLRVFLNEGAVLGNLLKKLVRGANDTSYAHHLLGHFVAAAASGKTGGPLTQLFSNKEKQVVDLILKGVSNQKIAEALFISVNTMNSHMRNIYAKLGVRSRLQAVDRLRKLGIS